MPQITFQYRDRKGVEETVQTDLRLTCESGLDPEIDQGGPHAMSLAFLVRNFYAKVFGTRMAHFFHTQNVLEWVRINMY